MKITVFKSSVNFNYESEGKVQDYIDLENFRLNLMGLNKERKKK